MPAVSLRRSGPVATITLNRPERLNAMNLGAWHELSAILSELAGIPECRVVVFRGAGERGFCAGHDLSAFEDERRSLDQVRHFSAAVSDAMRRLSEFEGTTVAGIHGFCMGAGLQIALECDVRIARADTVAALTPKKVGLFLEYDLMDVLVAAVGQARALEIVLEGASLPATRALQTGLVTEVVAAANFERRLDEIAAASARRTRTAEPRSLQRAPGSSQSTGLDRIVPVGEFPMWAGANPSSLRRGAGASRPAGTEPV